MPVSQTQLEFAVRKSLRYRSTKYKEYSENTVRLGSAIRSTLPSAIVAKNEITPTKRRPQTQIPEELSPTKLKKVLPLSPRKNFENSTTKTFQADGTDPRRKILDENKTRSPLKPVNSVCVNSPIKQLTGAAKITSGVQCSIIPKLQSPVKKPAETPQLKSLTKDSFEAAKKALNTQQPNQLLCREAEIRKISDFLDANFNKAGGGKPSLKCTEGGSSECGKSSLYISGAPGTGKTAVIKQLLSNHCEACRVKQIFVNSMTIRSPYHLYKYIASHILSESQLSKLKNKSSIIKHLQRCITNQGDKILLVLDEMDQLDTKKQEVLYTIFEWPSLQNSRIVLIGIANALDLTDRILPRICSKISRPQLLNFAPYTKDEIVTVLQSRLEQASAEIGSPVVLDNAAVTFCARKTSAVAGDMRKALDICRRSIEVAELGTKKSQILQNKERSSLIKPIFKTPKPHQYDATDHQHSQQIVTTLQTVNLIQVAEVVDQVYGGVKSSAQTNTFPLQQKLVVCSILLLQKSSKFKDIPLNKAITAYNTVCKKRDVQPCDQSEFSSLCSLLEARGIISIKKGKEARLNKLSLKMNSKELEFALHDKLLITSVLESGL